MNQPNLTAGLLPSLKVMLFPIEFNKISEEDDDVIYPNVVPYVARILLNSISGPNLAMHVLRRRLRFPAFSSHDQRPIVTVRSLDANRDFTL